MNARKKYVISISLLFVIWLIVAAISVFTGAYDLGSIESILQDEFAKTVLFQIRLPRVLMATLAGGTLALTGAALQALFRNPLASPFTLGISGGASAGALIAVRLGLGAGYLGFSMVSITAFAFSLITMMFIYSMSRVGGVVVTGRLLLAGVVVNFLFSALVLFIQFFSSFSESIQSMRWVMGSLDVVGFESVWKALILVIPGCFIIISVTRDMNLLGLGEDVASSLGVSVQRVEKKIYFATSLAASAIISVTGPIAFIGLIIPHLIRMVLGSDNRFVVPCSFLLGASFLTAADTVARTVIAPVEIPVGIITALLGGVFFLWLMVKAKREEVI